MKKDIVNFIKWMFEKENKLLVKNSSGQRIADVYNKKFGCNISATIVIYHRDRWVLIDGEPYAKDKIPMYIFKHKDFEQYAKNHNIIIETMDDEQPNVEQSTDTVVENINE